MLSTVSDDVRATNNSGAGICTPMQCPNLIVGCCFADLFHDPNHLISSLLQWYGTPPMDTNNRDQKCIKSTILYFPITFTGITSVFPPHPFETVCCEYGLQHRIPSDTLAFQYYAKALTDVHRHNLNHHSIVSSVEHYGGISLGHGKSNWVIHPQHNKYLWETMLYFFGTVAAPAMQYHGWYSRGWIQRLRHSQPNIIASNVDLLFRLPLLGEWTFPQHRRQIIKNGKVIRSDRATYDEICFVGPYEVRCIKKDRNIALQPNQVLIQSEYSLISSGTELKIFQGKFDTDAPLDTTIQDFNQEKMSYPLAYGYSLVGKIIECGSNVADADDLLGRRVFTFSAHATQVTTDRSNVHLVPNDIEAIDAIFLPSVETALSLVHDARPLFGENIAIFGQGLIGLLVTAVLHSQYGDSIVKSSHGAFGTITTFDNIPDRLAASAQMGASQALLPSCMSGPFDVVLEVSGNRLALQQAIDVTCHAGRVIVGSWYGCDPISLRLGIDFHRSHKSIKASQVSEIPAELSKTWTKTRRFELAWALVKQIRPSRLITLKTTINNAQMAYIALVNGTQIAIAFQY
jgi:threonine dehydrogenase-like Zn-dependent dehydrogenase